MVFNEYGLKNAQRLTKDGFRAILACLYLCGYLYRLFGEEPPTRTSSLCHSDLGSLGSLTRAFELLLL